jgi:hypothetical protein
MFSLTTELKTMETAIQGLKLLKIMSSNKSLIFFNCLFQTFVVAKKMLINHVSVPINLKKIIALSL